MSRPTFDAWKRKNRGPVQTKIGTVIMRAGARGMTAEEVKGATRLKHQTATGEIRHMVTAGKLYIDGKRPQRNGILVNVYKFRDAPRTNPGLPLGEEDHA